MKPAEKPFSRRFNNVINHPTDLSTPVQSRSRISGHGVSQTWRKEPESDAQSVPESDAQSVGVSVPSTADSLESQLQSLQSAIRQLQPHRHHRSLFVAFFCWIHNSCAAQSTGENSSSTATEEAVNDARFVSPEHGTVVFSEVGPRDTTA